MVESKSVVAQIELRIGDIEMNFRFGVSDHRTERRERKKRGKYRWTWFLYISDGREEVEGSMGESKMAVWSNKEQKGEEKSVGESVDGEAEKEWLNVKEEIIF